MLGSRLGENDGEGEGRSVHDSVGAKGAPHDLPYGCQPELKMKAVLVLTSGSGPPAVPVPCLARLIQSAFAACQSG
jgi:hypothetical protein